MSLVLLEGFDNQGLGKTVLAGGSGFVAGRFGVGSAFLIDGQDTRTRWTLGSGEHSDVIWGAAIYPTSLVSVDTSSNNMPMHFQSDAGNTNHIVVNWYSDGTIYVRRGTNGTATVIAQSAAGVMTSGAWQYLEVRIVLHDTSGVVQVRRNGQQVINASGLDTKNGGTKSVIDSISLWMTTNTNGAADTYFDDMYVLNAVDGTSTQGAANNTFLGDCRVETSVATSDSTPLQWTPSTGTSHFALVDEIPSNDADYLSSASSGLIDMWGVTDLSDADQLVYGLQLSGRASKSTSGTRTVKFRIDSNGTAETFSEHFPSTGYTLWYEMLNNDPDGNIAWTAAKVNSLLVGIESG